MITSREQVLPTPDRSHGIAANLAESHWLSRLPSGHPAVIVADGLLAFMPKQASAGMLQHLVDHFPYGEIAFNGYTRFHVWALTHYGPTRSIAPAVLNPGFDDPHQPERWDDRLRLIEEIVLTRDPEVADHPAALRIWTTTRGAQSGFSRHGTMILRYGFGEPEPDEHRSKSSDG